ncbi:MAG: RHS repeat-associated core domain-containing protein [Acutalibacteraceae bacterium]
MATGDDLLVFLYDDKGTPYGMFTVLDGVQQYFFYLYNAQGDVIAIIDDYAERVVNYEYSAWGELLSVTGSKADTVGTLNPFRYRGYCYDTETGLYYVSSRYYDPEIGRFISADDTEYLGADGSVLSCNLFAYCMNNPVNRFDVDGNWSLPNWAKVAIGAVATVAAVAVTVATGGAAAPVLIGVAASTIGGAATSAIKHRVTTGSWEGAGKAALNGAADGFMTGGLCALGGSVIGGATRTIKNARSGITIGKMGQFDKVAEITKTRHYSGLKEFNFIEKTLGKKAAETVGWWQNKCVLKGVMALKGSIYDCGGALTGAYAKEVALTKGYQYLYNVWLM